MDGKRQERRFHFRGRARAGRRVELEYRTVGDGGESLAPQRAVTSNIGVGGAFVLTQEPLAVGTLLRITLNVPTTEQAIETDARVRWVITPESADELHAAGMGLKFQRLDVDALLLLSEYFASLTPKTSDLDDE